MTKRERDRAEFVARLVSEIPDKVSAVTDAAFLIMRHGATYARIQEAWCNEEMGDRRTREMMAKEARIEKRITELCEPFGFKADFQGDPRGATVKIRVPSGYTNDWGRTGICVPGA